MKELLTSKYQITKCQTVNTSTFISAFGSIFYIPVYIDKTKNI